MAKHEKFVEEGSMLFPYTLVISGAILSTIALVESYLQVTKSPVTLLEIAHQYGILVQYNHALEPNRGIWHPIAWVGSAFFCLMMLYSVRKHFSFMYGLGALRHWLNIHMWLGIVATVFVTTHTTYKIGGIVSLSFWSMILVAGSGVIGRYIYIQIPRGISGNELKIDEIKEIMSEINSEIERYALEDQNILHYFEQISGPKKDPDMWVGKAIFLMIANDFGNIWRMMRIRRELRHNDNIDHHIRKRLVKLIHEKGGLVRSSNFLAASQSLLHYWHVFHKPFAIIMFIIMFLHIGVYYLFRANA